VARAPAILLGASFFDGLPEPAMVVTLRASQVISLERRTVMRLAGQHPGMGRALLAHLAQSVRRHVRRIDEVASGPVDERVRHLLEGLANDHGDAVRAGEVHRHPAPPAGHRLHGERDDRDGEPGARPLRAGGPDAQHARRDLAQGPVGEHEAPPPGDEPGEVHAGTSRSAR